MVSTAFWSHTIWFLLLGLMTVIQLVIILSKVNNRMVVFALYLTISGMAFSFELVILSFLKAYSYHPMLVPHSPPDDSIAGNLFSQFSVSATALMIVALNLKYYWYLFFALLYGLIEELFLALGIYQQNWYQTWMTVVLMPVFFGITKHLYRRCFTQLKGFLRYVFIFLGLVTLHEHMIVWVLRLTGVQLFSENLLPDKQHSLALLAGVYMLLLGVIIMLLYYTGIRWRWKIVVMMLLYFAHFLAMRFDLIIFKAGWFWISTSISIWSMYVYTYMLDKLYKSRKEIK